MSTVQHAAAAKSPVNGSRRLVAKSITSLQDLIAYREDRDCPVVNMAVVLYDIEMKQGSTISPLSLLMKGETVPFGSRWIGIPTQRLGE